MQPVITRFTSFRDRSKFYKARKNIKEALGYGVSLDLTSNRLKLPKEARNMVEEVDSICFACSDINCNLRVLTTNGKQLEFTNKNDVG